MKPTPVGSSRRFRNRRREPTRDVTDERRNPGHREPGELARTLSRTSGRSSVCSWSSTQLRRRRTFSKISRNDGQGGFEMGSYELCSAGSGNGDSSSCIGKTFSAAKAFNHAAMATQGALDECGAVIVIRKADVLVVEGLPQGAVSVARRRSGVRTVKKAREVGPGDVFSKGRHTWGTPFWVDLQGSEDALVPVSPGADRDASLLFSMLRSLRPRHEVTMGRSDERKMFRKSPEPGMILNEARVHDRFDSRMRQHGNFNCR